MKKVLLTLLVLAVAISTMAATFTLKQGQTVTFSAGRAGVAFTKSQLAGELTIKRKDTSNPPGKTHPAFTQRLLDVRLTDRDGNRIKFVVGPVYVFFNVSDHDFRLYEKGKLGIYYWDDWKGEWTKCNTFSVDGGPGNRLACRIRVFGLYGLGSQ